MDLISVWLRACIGWFSFLYRAAAYSDTDTVAARLICVTFISKNNTRILWSVWSIEGNMSILYSSPGRSNALELNETPANRKTQKRNKTQRKQK